MSSRKSESLILEHFTGTDDEVDYHGTVIDAEHVRAYLDEARRRVGLISQQIGTLLAPGSRVLDVGAAYGWTLLELEEAGFAVEGAELEINMDSYCRALRAHEIPVTAWDLHGECPFAPGTFDAVIASEVLEHLQISLTGAIRRLAAVVKDGGVLVVTTPNVYRLVNLWRIARGLGIAEAFPDQPARCGGVVIDDRTHPREPSLRELVEAAEMAGLKVVEARRFEARTPRSWRARTLSLVSRWWGSHLLMVART